VRDIDVSECRARLQSARRARLLRRCAHFCHATTLGPAVRNGARSNRNDDGVARGVAAGLRSTGKTDYCCIPYTQSVSTCQQDSTIMCDAGFGLSCAGTDTPTRGGEGQGPMRSRLSRVTRAALHGQPWVLCEARILLVKQAEAEDRAARRLDPLAVDAVVA